MKGKFLILIILVMILVFSTSVNAAIINLVVPPDWSFDIDQSPQTTPYDHRQLVVAPAGDVNGDGFEDLLVGDRDHDISPYTHSGRAWLFYGSADGLAATPDVVIDPPQMENYGFFGSHVGSAGDVNDDGYADFMISMANYDSSSPDEGAVFLWYGSPTGPQASYDWMARGNAVYAHFGISMDGGGDVNGDGYDDVVVGAWRYDDNVVSHAYVWYGSASGLGPDGTPANADWFASDTYPGMSGGTAFGTLVRLIGDVNGDGYDEVLVGANAYDNGLTDQGAVYIWHGSGSGPGPAGTTANADWMAEGGQASSRFGWSGDGVGDLNGDGYEDLAVGAYAYDNPEINEGAVFVWYGSATGLGSSGSPVNADWMAEGNAEAAYLGFCLRSGGDTNRDGIGDILATANGYSVDSAGGQITNAGAWFLWQGSQSGGLGENGDPVTADLSGYGDQDSGQLGRDECGTADVNGDGLDDIFVAAWLYDQPEQDEGVVFGYYSLIRIFLPAIQRNP